MSSIKNPVGPQPPSVYWRRRLLLAIGLLAVVIVIILIVVRPGSGDAAENNTKPNPAASATDDATAPPETNPEDPCDPSVITLEPVTDLGSYPAGQQPLISMTITNAGSATCTLDVGTAVQEYQITSGSDRIWDSKDCQSDPQSLELQLEPGVPQTTTPFAWPLVRSVPGCAAGQPAAIGGGASYHLKVLLGEIESSDTTQFILG